MKIFNSEKELKSFLKDNNLDGLDSEFSINTKNLKKQHNTEIADFNRWWVLTPIDWICPVCNREKEKIIRNNKHNHLSGALHNHHDHMINLLTKRVYDLKLHKVEESSQILSFIHYIKSFEYTIICFDCNAADTEAKKIAHTHEFFSFSPDDISKIIIVSNNTPHLINSDQAKKIWSEKEKIFQKRKKLIESVKSIHELLMIKAQEKIWYIFSNISSSKVTEDKGLLNVEKYGLYSFAEGKYPENFLYNSAKYSYGNNKWRTKNTQICNNTPTEKEIRNVIEIYEDEWGKVKETWYCQICDRNKIDCIQFSINKKRWMFKAAKKSFGNKNMELENYERITICNACFETLKSSQREIDVEKKLGTFYAFVTKEQLRDFIICRKNNMHQIDNEYFESILPEIYSHYESLCGSVNLTV